MRKLNLILILIYFGLIVLIFQSCGPNAEQMAKIKTQDSLRRVDSLATIHKQIVEKQRQDSLAMAKEKENKEWEEVKSSKTIKSYQKFIDNYPKSQFYSFALNSIDSINYNSIKSRQDYQKFVERHPKSKYIDNAKKKLRKVSFTISQGQKPLSNEEIVIFPVIGDNVGQDKLGFGKTDENGYANIEFYNPKNYTKYVLIEYYKESYLLLYQDNGNALTFTCDDYQSTCELGKLVFKAFGFTVKGK